MAGIDQPATLNPGAGGGGGTPDNRHKGKARECALGTGRMSFFSNRIKAQVLLMTRPLPIQMPMTLSSGLLTQQIDPRPPSGLRPLNVGFEFRSAS